MEPRRRPKVDEDRFLPLRHVGSWRGHVTIAKGSGNFGVELWYRVLVLSVGGALGVNARYWLGVWMNRWVGHSFPWATFTINVSGSFAIGFLTTLLIHRLPHPHARLFVLVGFLGGYTTFSTFAFESLTLWESRAMVRTLSYVLGSVAAGLVAVILGTALARALVLQGVARSSDPGPPAQRQPLQPSESRPTFGVNAPKANPLPKSND